MLSRDKEIGHRSDKVAWDFARRTKCSSFLLLARALTKDEARRKDRQEYKQEYASKSKWFLPREKPLDHYRPQQAIGIREWNEVGERPEESRDRLQRPHHTREKDRWEDHKREEQNSL